MIQGRRFLLRRERKSGVEVGNGRDDVAKVLPKYLDMGLVPHDPFSVLDQEGVGEMIKIGI